MSINDEYTRAQLRAALAQIAAQIDDLKARIDTESRTLYTKLSAEIVVLQKDLRNLEAEVAAARSDNYALRIASQIEDLRAKGDAAYDLLQTSIATQLDPTEAEIRRLEVIAATTDDEVKAKVLARIDELKSARIAAQAADLASHQTGQPGDVHS